MRKAEIKIGIALSGGGIRATIFHLGVLKWLAEKKLLENIEHISSVSGGSIAAGLIFTSNGMKWPTNEEYLYKVLPGLKTKILNKDIQSKVLSKSLKDVFHVFGSKSNKLSSIMEDCWGMNGTLGELVKSPKWSINCTTFETGKSFRFTQDKCGDYKIGYFSDNKFPVSEAVASSAGFPILVGMYELDAQKYQWKKYNGEQAETPGDKIHLWDGGVYDNLGLEPIFKMSNGGECTKGIDFCIVSDASAGSLDFFDRGEGFLGKTKDIKRLLDISMEQIGALRARSFVDFSVNKKIGMYIKIGNSAEKITSCGKISFETKKQLIEECLAKDKCDQAKFYSTTLHKPSESDFELLLRHGYENAKCTYESYDSLLKSKLNELGE